MKPSQLASQLRRIASKIEASKKPDRDLVARDLKRTLAALDPDPAANVLGIAKSIDVPGLGPVSVVLTKVGASAERYMTNVEFDITPPGENSIHVVCESLDRGRNLTKFATPEEEARMGEISELLPGWDAITFAQVALSEIGNDYFASIGEETPDFPYVEDGYIRNS